MTMPKGHGRHTLEAQKALGFSQAERAAKLAILYAYRFKRREMAVILGCSEKMVDKYMTQFREPIDALVAFIKLQMPPLIGTKATVGTVTDEKQYVASLRQKLGSMVEVLERALVDRDIKVAMSAAVEINKVLGLTQKLKVEHGGKVTHEHEHRVVPAGLLPVVNGPRERRGLPALTVTPLENNDSAAS